MPKARLIDGTTLEGGGQLVRLSAGLAAITGRPVKLTHIRGGRSRGGGLKAQHLTAVQWLANACNADLEGATVGSRDVLFRPGCGPRKMTTPLWDRTTTLADGTRARVVVIDLNGVGATTLVLQAILPLLLFRVAHDASETLDDSTTGPLPILLTLKGGTNVSFSPSVDYVQQVLFPNLEFLGLPHMKLYAGHALRRGWSHGLAVAGEVAFLIQPLVLGATLSPLILPSRRGRVTRIDVFILASDAYTRGLVKKRTAEAVSTLFPSVEQATVLDEASGGSKRLYVLLVAHTESGFRLGRDYLYDNKIGKTTAAIEGAVSALVEGVVNGLAEELANDVEGLEEGARCLDFHMEDQVVIYMALAKGRSRCERVVTGDARLGLRSKTRSGPSLHTQTVQWVIGELLGVEFSEAGECEGVGLVAGASPGGCNGYTARGNGQHSKINGLSIADNQ